MYTVSDSPSERYFKRDWKNEQVMVPCTIGATGRIGDKFIFGKFFDLSFAHLYPLSSSPPLTSELTPRVVIVDNGSGVVNREPFGANYYRRYTTY